MKVLIEEYRNFEILFDTRLERFQTVAMDESAKESKSFSAVKKFIDQWHKDNLDFQPFTVTMHPSHSFFRNEDKPLTIIGLSKDGRFTATDPEGKHLLIPNYLEERMILHLPENECPLKKIADLKAVKTELMKEYDQRIREHKKNLTVVYLQDYRQQLFKG